MTTLLDGFERAPAGASETLQLPTHAPASRVPAGPDQVAVAQTEIMSAVPEPMIVRARWDDEEPSIPPALRKRARAFPAFPAMTAGLLSTAAAWLGLALVLIAVAYPLSDFARASLSLIGSSMIAVVIAFALSSRPEYA